MDYLKSLGRVSIGDSSKYRLGYRLGKKNFAIDISSDGTFIAVMMNSDEEDPENDLSSGKKKNKKYKFIKKSYYPYTARTSGIKACLTFDNGKYVLGLGDLKCREAFTKAHYDAFEKYGLPEFKAIADFCSNLTDELVTNITTQCLIQLGKENGDPVKELEGAWFAFNVGGTPAYSLDSVVDAIEQEFLEEYSKKDKDGNPVQERCLLSGEGGFIASDSPYVFTKYGASPLNSYNIDSLKHNKLEDLGDHTRLGLRTLNKAVRNLEHIIESSSIELTKGIDNQDKVFIIWSDAPDQVLDEDESWSDQNDTPVDFLKKLVKAFNRSKEKFNLDPNIYGAVVNLGAAKSRLYVESFYQTSLQQVIVNVENYSERFNSKENSVSISEDLDRLIKLGLFPESIRPKFLLDLWLNMLFGLEVKSVWLPTLLSALISCYHRSQSAASDAGQFKKGLHSVYALLPVTFAKFGFTRSTMSPMQESSAYRMGQVVAIIVEAQSQAIGESSVSSNWTAIVNNPYQVFSRLSDMFFKYILKLKRNTAPEKDRKVAEVLESLYNNVGPIELKANKLTPEEKVAFFEGVRNMGGRLHYHLTKVGGNEGPREAEPG